MPLIAVLVALLQSDHRSVSNIEKPESANSIMDQPVDQLWFSPDVVILRAQTRTFRVFVDILKEKSSVFADMFTFPQPPSSGMEKMDGVPVVNVHDDPTEMEVFLKAIFDSAFFMPPPAESEISQTLGILRLAHKYDVPYLRRRALEHMGTVHPTRLSEWKFNSAKLRPPNSDELIQRMATIDTATEVGALWLLPTAYYDICRKQLSIFIDDPYWLALGNKERRACMLGYQAQIQQPPTSTDFLSSQTTTARTHAHGRNAPLECWSEAVWNTVAGRICGPCVEKLKPLHAAARQQCWDGLPQMFGLPGWEILEDMRAAALAT
ncbi:hypothetical protein DFH06DRAFT_1302363 [Mycena polygramma]|nr:hypothetical protein DFH06DRAFT_1302363 [Mycena polygramma]